MGSLKVAVVLPNGFYAPDVIGAVDVLSYLPNTSFYFVSDTLQSDSFMGYGPRVCVNSSFEKCPQVDVLIVGALSPNAFLNKNLQSFILSQEKEAKAVIGVCAGVLLLGSLGLLNNKLATTNFQQRSLLKSIGAVFKEEQVVKDGKFYTAGPAVFSYKVGIEVVNDLISKEWAHYIEDQCLGFSPNPIYKIGYPVKASKGMQRFSTILFFLVNVYYKAIIWWIKKFSKK